MKSLIEACVGKITQDKLTIRRTTLSGADQNFIDEVAKAAAISGIDLPSGITNRATKNGVPEVNVPTESNTKAEIQAFLDERGVDYESDANKAALLLLVSSVS